MFFPDRLERDLPCNELRNRTPRSRCATPRRSRRRMPDCRPEEAARSARRLGSPKTSTSTRCPSRCAKPWPNRKLMVPQRSRRSGGLKAQNRKIDTQKIDARFEQVRAQLTTMEQNRARTKGPISGKIAQIEPPSRQSSSFRFFRPFSRRILAVRDLYARGHFPPGKPLPAAPMGPRNGLRRGTRSLWEMLKCQRPCSSWTIPC